MPKLKRKKESGSPGDWHIDIPNSSSGPPVYTLQVRPAGRDILLSADLDHNHTPKRTAYVDWDLFKTLDELGLLYTKGESSESTDSELQPADNRSLENLSPEQRVAFVNGLVEHEPVENLVESEQILELFQSLSPEVSEYDMLLTGILEGTPFEPATVLNIATLVDKYAPARSPNITTCDSGLLALVMKLVFETLASNAGELFDNIVQSKEYNELWLLKKSFAVGGNELILHPVTEHLQQGLSETGRKNLRADSLDILDPLYNRFLETIYPSLSKGQLQADLEPYGTTVENEVSTGHFLLFPKPADRNNSELKSSINKI